MNKLDQHKTPALGFQFNEGPTAMLKLPPLTIECLNTGDIPEDTRIQHSMAFEDISNAFVISIKFISLINLFDFVFIYMLHVYLHVTGLRLIDNPVY